MNEDYKYLNNRSRSKSLNLGKSKSKQLNESKQAPVQDEDFTMEIQHAISILNDLKNKLS